MQPYEVSRGTVFIKPLEKPFQREICSVRVRGRARNPEVLRFQLRFRAERTIATAE
jgi:hypothetical protein